MGLLLTIMGRSCAAHYFTAARVCLGVRGVPPAHDGRLPGPQNSGMFLHTRVTSSKGTHS